MGNITMLSKDAISAKAAECFVTIDGSRYNFMNVIDIEAKMEKVKVEIPILGRMNKGHKAVATNGTGSATFHYNTSLFREMMKKFQDTGEDIYFDIQITNDDPTSDVGRQTVILIDCNMDSVIIAKFDADGEYLDEKCEFTFERFEIPEKFKALSGM